PASQCRSNPIVVSRALRRQIASRAGLSIRSLVVFGRTFYSLFVAPLVPTRTPCPPKERGCWLAEECCLRPVIPAHGSSRIVIHRTTGSLCFAAGIPDAICDSPSRRSALLPSDRF